MEFQDDVIDPSDLNDSLLADTNPATPSKPRQKLRPIGFSLVTMDKDGSNTLRKPRPWSMRKILRVIDEFPSPRDELLERLPAGR